MESVPSNTTPILAVDDDEGLLSSLEAAIIRAGMPAPALVSDSRAVMDLLRRQAFSVVLLDLVMPHINGLALLEQIKAQYPSIECLIITATDDTASAVTAVRLGAYDYLVKPVDPEKLTVTIKNALERFALKQELSLYKRSATFKDLRLPEAFNEMIAADEAMARIFLQAEAVAPTPYSLIISGESGTGKELLARIIHRLSPRASGPFVAVNMAAFSASLFESEFFGYERGAFTGATAEKTGFFEAAAGGTLFLDEIAELDVQLQAKLLRVMQENEFYRLGSTRSRSADVRIIAATNRDLHLEITEKRFREDLYYRLAMFSITIPPLRQRTKDIIPLALHFMKVHAVLNSKDLKGLSAELKQALVRYGWPGNVRELENVISKAVVLAKSPILTPVECSLPGLPGRMVSENASPLISLQELEHSHIARVLSHTGGNKTAAAAILGIDLRTLQRKLKK
jgi:DNA-binding NtrC family response regulator